MLSLLKEIGLWLVAVLGGLFIIMPVMAVDAPAWWALVVVAGVVIGAALMGVSLPRTSLYRNRI